MATHIAIETTQFKQTNLSGVLSRANEILAHLSALGVTPDSEDKMLTLMWIDMQVGDEWERAAIALAQVELFERRMRAEDPSVESYPEGWNGGIPQRP